MEREYPLALAETARCGLLGSDSHHIGGQAGQAGAVFHHDAECVGGVEQIFVECQEETCKLGIELRQAGLVFVVEQGAVAHKVFVILLDCQATVGCQADAVAVLVEIFEAVKEAGVHRYLILRAGELGIKLLGDGHHLVRRVGLLQGAKHEHHLVEQVAGILIRHDGILKCGSLRAGDYRVDGLALHADTLAQGRQIVGCGDFVKGRYAVGGVILLQEWIGVHFFLLARGQHSHRCGHEGGGGDGD